MSGVLAWAAMTGAEAAVAYSEAVSGDLANVGTSATPVTLTSGLNRILGATGRSEAGVVDRDYFTVNVPFGMNFSALTVVDGTVQGGGVAIIALQAGNRFTVSPNSGSAAGMLGWYHYASVDAGTDILPSMGQPAFGSSGFTAPLPAGNYSFWIQELNTGTYPYGFDLELTPIPEANSVIAGAGLVIFGLLSAFRRNREA